jgi:4-oxalomesaconate tautomerase
MPRKTPGGSNQSVHTEHLQKGSRAAGLARLPAEGCFLIEHPIGVAEVILDLASDGTLRAAGTIRTARKLFDGHVFPGPAR